MSADVSERLSSQGGRLEPQDPPGQEHLEETRH